MDDKQAKIESSYGYLFEKELIKEINSVSKLKDIKEGDVLMSYGQDIFYMPLLLKGAIKIYRLDEENEELLLYFLESGDACTMTMTCCIGNRKSEIRAIAEKDTQLIMIPVSYMEKWVAQYASWRAFVFDSYNTRFNEMLEAIDNLAFKNMHERLYKYLKDKVLINKSEVINTTHQSIAYDLHTSRVVISRLMKALENEGYIKINRNKIIVLKF